MYIVHCIKGSSNAEQHFKLLHTFGHKNDCTKMTSSAVQNLYYYLIYTHRGFTILFIFLMLDFKFNWQ